MPHMTSREMACNEFKRFVQGYTAGWDISLENVPLSMRSRCLSQVACWVKSKLFGLPWISNLPQKFSHVNPQHLCFVPGKQLKHWFLKYLSLSCPSLYPSLCAFFPLRKSNFIYRLWKASTIHHKYTLLWFPQCFPFFLPGTLLIPLIKLHFGFKL